MKYRTRTMILALAGVLLLAALACGDDVMVGPSVELATPENPVETQVDPADLDGDLARVTRIVDGDTIDVEIGGGEYRVRYIGVDTPERGDPYYAEASEANRQLVAGEDVILVMDVSETDRYGRLLRYVYLEDGTFVNAELVRQGYAQMVTYPPDVAYQDVFQKLQREARDLGLGLWELSEEE